ncbi:MAG: SurA N-terminal domain-containing protein [Gammaproteobacteria bacterium]|uniref:SurA N-terminal domain-containing protein n=1 Tax=Rhodoferax sp. TaxID=50421 RepID=UPI0017CCE6A4|nr:SurA N-terminal domain-containing protein [Rhodoferax sp.]MBU3899613.1 SurA N-terminal domain-containing protein [Gammaproteobacteria bacterium]MBA3056587.1 peptidyl-prolyl cis-trans isomerase [Rhodoferax sp.]MBU3998944.1 SurA N-terminal domain-containing protein [Gammaproteobacteria bacterium]MBU4018089.1 SurA N-terminal domain-containing protein [Gammaproteobacteria bacterium]MBU4080220.1 SurA N-terminal domain-containing protein [Gammaproteobacteria bacterium]
MFDFVRKHTKIMMAVMFLLIIPSFVLFGIDGYNQSRDGGSVVARVGSHDITQGEWDAMHKSESDRLRASMPNLDAKLLDSPAARYASLERLVRDRVLAQAAEKFKLTTSDARLARNLQENPSIASLRQPDGKLDMDRYRQLVASQGLSPEGFEARVRQDLSVRQVEAGVAGTGFAATSVADVALNAFFEKREVQITNFNAADFAPKVNPTDTELDGFYKANQSLFQSPEHSSVEYLVLDLDAVKKSIVISEADMKSYYEQNAERLSGKEERRASHILINAAKDAPVADRDKAKARADELLKAVRQAPDSFADMAKKNSQDAGSATNGGDLDFFSRGAMVKPFEDAAFAMKKGDISDVVESDFGYHIIQLNDIKKPIQRSFEELRAGIQADLQAQQAQTKFAETAEAFTNGVYEQSDSLKPVADKLKLEIKTATNVLRQPAAGATGVLASPKFLAAIFNTDSIEKKRNTEAIETAPNQLTAGRVTQYTPARTLPFTEVSQVVRERVVAARAAELAKKEGMEKLLAWKASPAAAIMPAPVVVSRDKAQNSPQQVLTAALRADVAALPAFVGVDLGAMGYSVVRVNKIVPRVAPTNESAKQDRLQYAQWWIEAEYQAYYELLKERFKAKIMTSRPTLTSTDLPLAAQN